MSKTILFSFISTKVTLPGGYKWMSYILSKKPVFITIPCFPGFSESMDSANNWCFAFGPVPCPAGSTWHGLRDTLSRGFHVQHALIFLLFHHAFVSSSSLYLYGFRLFLSADNSQIHTSSPFEPQTFDSNDSWTSLLGWEAVGFTAHPLTQLLKPEAVVSSLTHLPCLTPQRSSSKSRGFYLLSFSSKSLFSPFILTATSLVRHPSYLTYVTVTGLPPPVHSSSCNQNDLSKI